MKRQLLREFLLLTEVASERPVTQRGLAKRLNIALGLTNLLIRRLVKKGYVKVVTLERNQLQYLITPAGVAEKARLTYEYLEYSLYFYRHIRAFLTHALVRLQRLPHQRVILYGTGEVAEIACLIMQQYGIPLVQVVDGEGAGLFLGRPVRTLSDLSHVPYDFLVVAALKDRRQIVEQLVAHGVPTDKIIAIPDERTPEFLMAELEAVPIVPVLSEEEVRS